MGTLPPGSHGSCGTATDRATLSADACSIAAQQSPLDYHLTRLYTPTGVLARLHDVLRVRWEVSRPTYHMAGPNMALPGPWGRGARALRQPGRDAATSPRRIRQQPRGVNIQAAIGQLIMVTVVPALSVTTPLGGPFLKRKWSSCREAAEPAGS